MQTLGESYDKEVYDKSRLITHLFPSCSSPSSPMQSSQINFRSERNFHAKENAWKLPPELILEMSAHVAVWETSKIMRRKSISFWKTQRNNLSNAVQNRTMFKSIPDLVGPS